MPKITFTEFDGFTPQQIREISLAQGISAEQTEGLLMELQEIVDIRTVGRTPLALNEKEEWGEKPGCSLGLTNL